MEETRASKDGPGIHRVEGLEDEHGLPAAPVLPRPTKRFLLPRPGRKTDLTDPCPDLTPSCPLPMPSSPHLPCGPESHPLPSSSSSSVPEEEPLSGQASLSSAAKKHVIRQTSHSATRKPEIRTTSGRQSGSRKLVDRDSEKQGKVVSNSCQKVVLGVERSRVDALKI